VSDPGAGRTVELTIDEEKIEALTFAVLEGHPVDWESELARAPSPEHEHLVRNLWRLWLVAEANRQSVFGSRHDLPFHQWRHIRLLERLSSGAHGELFRAWDESLGREVALKLFPSDAIDTGQQTRILEEARRLARVRSEGVVRVLGADVDHRRVGFWMEYVSGEHLDAYLDRRGPLDHREVAQIGASLARAIGAAHDAGVLHGDVKAANVIRDRDGHVCLVDFGAGALLESPLGGRRAGTPLYMAPENLQDGVVSRSSDIYSLGVLLFYLVSSRYPFEGRDREGLLEAHLQGRRLSLAQLRTDIPPSFAAIVERCLAPDPRDRYASMAEVQSALAGHCAPEQVRSMRRNLLFVSGTVILVVLAFAVVVGLQRRPSTGAEAPSDRAAHLCREGVDAYERRDFDTARMFFRDAVAYDSSYAPAYYQWSICEAFWEESDRALQLARKAHQHSMAQPADEQLRMRCWYLLLDGRPEEALGLLRDRAARDHDDATAQYDLARTLWYHVGRTEEAIPYYRHAIELDPRYAAAYNDLAYCYAIVGKRDSAIACGRRYIALDPEEPNPYDTMGDIQAGSGADSSSKYYRLALAKKSNFVVSMEKLAEIAASVADFDSARVFLRRLLVLDDPRYRARARGGLAALLALQGNFEAALREVDSGLREDRRDGAFPREISKKYALKSHLLRATGDLEGALQAIETAVDSFAPGYPLPANYFAFYKVQLLLELKREDEAHRYVSILRRLRDVPSPRHAYPYALARGVLDLHDGRVEEAISDFDTALEQAPKHLFELVYLQARALEVAGETDQAVIHLQRGLTEVPSDMLANPISAARGWYHLGRNLDELGRHREAVQAYEKFLVDWGHADRRIPEVEDAKDRLARALE
jgi:tetratricopeptide (TPR) repeat protein/tRNA A-37 threonylcarbamoyl transferase component Bud32